MTSAQQETSDSEPLLYRKSAHRKMTRTLLLEFQAGLCAGCFEPDAWTLHVDHDHSTGLIRGLLCPSCNIGEGSRVIGWDRYVSSTPASEYQRGLPSALVTFIERAREAELKAAELVVRSWRYGFSGHAAAIVNAEHEVYRQWHSPQYGGPNWVFEGFEAAQSAHRVKVRAAVKQAVQVDESLLASVASAWGSGDRLRGDLACDVMSMWYRQWWDDREAEIRDALADALPMHAFSGDGPHCSLDACRIARDVHPNYRGMDEDYPHLGAFRRKLRLLHSLNASGTKEAAA